MVKTRKKVINTRELLGISSKSKRMVKENKNVNEIEKLDVSDKENRRKLQTKELIAGEHTTPLKIRQIRDDVSKEIIQNTEQLIKNPFVLEPRFTSTPHILKLKQNYVRIQESFEKSSAIVVSDSDATDTEVENTRESLKANVKDVPDNSYKSFSAESTERTKLQGNVNANTAKPRTSKRFRASRKDQNKIFMTHRFDQPNCSKIALSFNKKGAPLINVASRNVIISPSKESALQTKKLMQKKPVKASRKADNSTVLKSPSRSLKKQKSEIQNNEQKLLKNKTSKQLQNVSIKDSDNNNTNKVPKYKQAHSQLAKKSLFKGDRDVFDFPSSQDSQKSAESQDSYIKKLIERVNPKRLRKPRKPKVKVKKANKVSGLKGKAPKINNKEKEAIVEPLVKPNKTLEVMQKIRQRFKTKEPAQESNISTNDASVDKSIEIETNSMDDRSSHVSFEDNSMLNQPPLSPPLQNISEVVVTSKIITNPVPSTSTGGWTLPDKTNISRRQLQSVNTSSNNTSSRQFSRFSQFNIPNTHSSTFDRIKNLTNRPLQKRRSVFKAISPWRVNDEERVPRTKYFSLSKDLLPSYASDTIIDDRSNHIPERSSLGLPPDMSLNNSDIENIAPQLDAASRTVDKSRQILNRVPLQAINIQDISYQSTNTSVKPSPLVEHSLTRKEIEEGRRIQVLSNVSLPKNKFHFVRGQLIRNATVDMSQTNSTTNQSSKGHKTTDKSSELSDCFGFDEHSDDDLSMPDHEITTTDLKQRLKELKRLGPLEKSNSANHDMPILFKSPTKPLQNVLSMFATNVNKENASTPLVIKKPRKVQHYEDDEVEFDCSVSSDNEQELSDIQNENTKQSMTRIDTMEIVLFDDPEDEFHVTKEPDTKRRSYIGRQKRRRVKFSDYETTEDELEADIEAHRKRRVKKKKVNIEKTQEFKKFVNEFTSMCDEVEDYELVVE